MRSSLSLGRFAPFFDRGHDERTNRVRNWRCALASPAEPLWKKWSHSGVELAASIRPATVSGSAGAPPKLLLGRR